MYSRGERIITRRNTVEVGRVGSGREIGTKERLGRMSHTNRREISKECRMIHQIKGRGEPEGRSVMRRNGRK